MEKEFTTLEFDKVLAALAEHAISPAAKELCLSLSPAETREDAEKALGQTASAENCCSISERRRSAVSKT